MGIRQVREEFASRGIHNEITELPGSSATVELAAAALGVKTGRIAKTMALRLKGRGVLLLVAAGDARLDNRKLKETFKVRTRMLPAGEVEEITGHPVGGVCPFGLKQPLEVCLDVSLKAFDQVYPAAGSRNSAVRCSPEELLEITGGSWVDVCAGGPHAGGG